MSREMSLDEVLAEFRSAVAMNRAARRDEEAAREELERLQADRPLRPSKGFRCCRDENDPERGWLWLPCALVVLCAAAVFTCGHRAEVGAEVIAAGLLHDMAIARSAR